uniref:Uncharacterized protein n=1 Tax=Kwoniella dejecticola CBS 10117 TaxID=1296121 RepID=A0A1A5ZUT4_9TREE|nr:uncharacterized protein I303_08342 [Kwoniella dejecticola CBS 10117]OBR81572.1 hypothetical protein I303_08342 [Kwoniella dejecticola CBS 10117]
MDDPHNSGNIWCTFHIQPKVKCGGGGGAIAAPFYELSGYSAELGRDSYVGAAANIHSPGCLRGHLVCLAGDTVCISQLDGDRPQRGEGRGVSGGGGRPTPQGPITN